MRAQAMTLVELLRAGAHHEHDDLSVMDEAADRIEALECERDEAVAAASGASDFANSVAAGHAEAAEAALAKLRRKAELFADRQNYLLSVIGNVDGAVDAARAFLAKLDAARSALAEPISEALPRATERLSRAIKALGVINQDGTILFEASPTKDQAAYDAWVELNNAAKAALAQSEWRPLWTGTITGVDTDDSGRTWIACDCVIPITVNAEYSLITSLPTWGGLR